MPLEATATGLNPENQENMDDKKRKRKKTKSGSSTGKATTITIGLPTFTQVRFWLENWRFILVNSD